MNAADGATEKSLLDGLVEDGRPLPLIAHDRAGFGGGLASSGLLVTLCVWYAPPSRAFSQALVLAGIAGFGCAIGVHYVEGYTDIAHLGPAIAGAMLFVTGATLKIAGRRHATSGGQARGSSALDP